MFKVIAASSVVALLMLGGPSAALAADHGDHGDHGNSGHGNDDHEARAPEPLTMIGLGLGAAGIVAARWKSRKSARKP